MYQKSHATISALWNKTSDKKTHEVDVNFFQLEITIFHRHNVNEKINCESWTEKNFLYKYIVYFACHSPFVFIQKRIQIGKW